MDVGFVFVDRDLVARQCVEHPLNLTRAPVFRVNTFTNSSRVCFFNCRKLRLSCEVNVITIRGIS
jgi:hypothetical protein